MQFLEKPLCPIRHLNPDRFLNEIGSQLHQCFMDGIPEPEIIRSDPTKAQILLPSQDRCISLPVALGRAGILGSWLNFFPW